MNEDVNKDLDKDLGKEIGKIITMESLKSWLLILNKV
jgi:hypothetical protein